MPREEFYWRLGGCFRAMKQRDYPILNVTTLRRVLRGLRSGLEEGLDWGTPPRFGAVYSGEEVQIFFAGRAGGRGKGTNTTTFQVDGTKWATRRVDVRVGGRCDAVHRECVAAGLDVTLRRMTCRGKCERCICGIRMDMCFA